MQVAKINADNEIEEVGELKALFPNTSFPAQGPNLDWYAENNVMSVTVGLPFDPATQKQEHVDAYISDGVVYTVRLVNLTDEEKTTYKILRMQILLHFKEQKEIGDWLRLTGWQ